MTIADRQLGRGEELAGPIRSASEQQQRADERARARAAAARRTSRRAIGGATKATNAIGPGRRGGDGGEGHADEDQRDPGALDRSAEAPGGVVAELQRAQRPGEEQRRRAPARPSRRRAGGRAPSPGRSG